MSDRAVYSNHRLGSHGAPYPRDPRFPGSRAVRALQEGLARGGEGRRRPLPRPRRRSGRARGRLAPEAAGGPGVREPRRGQAVLRLRHLPGGETTARRRGELAHGGSRGARSFARLEHRSVGLQGLRRRTLGACRLPASPSISPSTFSPPCMESRSGIVDAHRLVAARGSGTGAWAHFARSNCAVCAIDRRGTGLVLIVQ